MKKWTTRLLLVLGAPLWLPLLLAAGAILFALYVVLWSVIVSLWAAFASLIVASLGGLVVGAILTFDGSTLSGIAIIGASIFCAGLAIFAFFVCKIATRGAVLLTQTTVSGIIRSIKKEAV